MHYSILSTKSKAKPNPNVWIDVHKFSVMYMWRLTNTPLRGDQFMPTRTMFSPKRFPCFAIKYPNSTIANGGFQDRGSTLHPHILLLPIEILP